MKRALIFLAVILIFPQISSLDITVEKVSEDEVMIVGLEKPATFDISIQNNGEATDLEFYNLVGLRMFPQDTVHLNALEKKDITLTVYPIGEFKVEGIFTFNYYIRDQNDTDLEKSLTFKRIKLEDAFQIGAGQIYPESNEVEIYIKNKENFNFGKIKFKLDSDFFNFEDEFEIGPYDQKNFTIELDKEQFKKLLAGFYTVETEISTDSLKAKVTTDLEFVERGIIRTQEDTSGILVRKNTITKINDGNVVTPVELTLQKNIISRLFTTFSTEPDSVQRSGFLVKYTWVDSINPGEELSVTIRTNWTFPFLIIVFLIAIIIISKKYSSSPLMLKKKVSFVKAKGGEFALKVTITAKANSFLEKVNIIERLPPLVKLYPKFGSEEPARIDEKKKRIEWNFNYLDSGEVRVLSYVIYSKVGVMGKFALPSTRAIYEKAGELKETNSNRAFFLSEPRGEDVIE